MSIQSMITLIKRECWEYKRAFITFPLFLAILASVIIIWGGLNFTSNYHVSYVDGADSQFNLTISNTEVEVTPTGTHTTENVRQISSDDYSQYLMDFTQYFTKALTTIFMVLSGFVAMYYALGALYNDRLDRSILFWKSMPITESQNVFTKLVVALVVVPFIAIGLALAVIVLTHIVFFISTAFTSNDIFYQSLSVTGILLSCVNALAEWFILATLMLPVIAWLLFVSAASPRSPFLFSMVPPIALGFIEQLTLGSSYIKSYIKGLSDRISEGIMIHSRNVNMEHDLWQSLFSIEVVVGLLLASVLLAGAVWFRNHRFEI